MRSLFQTFIICLLVNPLALAQNDIHPDHQFKHHRLALFIGNAHVPAGEPDIGKNETIIIPVWGIDYEYWFNHLWAIGLYSDIELETYIVNNGELQDLERNYPFVASLVLVYVPWKNLSLYIGPGVEIEEHENFLVGKIGLEYEIELPHHWDLAPGISYDNKEGEFDTWSIGLSIGKRF